MKVGDLVVCAERSADRLGLVHPGGIYRLTSVHITNYSKAGPRDEVCLEADDTGARSASLPQSWFAVLLAWRHYSLDWFCVPCNRFEPERTGDFLACLECGHVYRTAMDLVEEENNVRRRFGEPELLLLIDPIRTVMAQIHSCPLCSHDW